MESSYSYKKLINVQWISGFVVLFLFLLLALANSDAYQRNVGLFIFACLMTYGFFLYIRFLQDPSEISIKKNELILKFRKIPEKTFNCDQIEYIKKSNNPFLDHIKGKLLIKIKDTDEKYRILGNITNFDDLIKTLDDSGFNVGKH